MNEIEKMYENAGIGKQKYFVMQDENYKDVFEIKYPSFTAEKQLSLMAFLINRKVELSFKAEQGEITVEAISRGLAGIVNRIWQDLTSEEKQQVKGILE